LAAGALAPGVDRSSIGARISQKTFSSSVSVGFNRSSNAIDAV
jgi:hypothetical protein